MSASSALTSDASKTPSRAIPKVLFGQKALVTGANSGIGKATAIALGQAGADVVVNYVSGDDHADAVVGEIRRSGAKAYAHKADISQEEQVQQMFHRMLEELGTIDILVNNAGLQRDPYKRIGEPVNIARAAVWLASDDSTTSMAPRCSSMAA